jgi:hypothetical protein
MDKIPPDSSLHLMDFDVVYKEACHLVACCFGSDTLAPFTKRRVKSDGSLSVKPSLTNGRMSRPVHIIFFKENRIDISDVERK